MHALKFVFLLFLSEAFAGKRKSGETTYILNFQESVSDCEDFTNKNWDASGLSLNQDDDYSNYLQGNIKILNDIGEGVKVILKIYKDVEVGREFMYTVEADLCEHIEDKDTPWAPLISAMGITSCPIEAKDYAIDELKLNVGYAKDAMKHEFVGDYYASLELKMEEDLDVAAEDISCHVLAVSIEEIKKDNDGDE